MAAQDTLQLVKSFHTIDPIAAYYKSATIPDSAQFGQDVAGMGDIDRDGVPDLAVGLGKDTIGSLHGGTLNVLFMNSDGTVKASKRISSHTDSLDVQLDMGDRFGTRIANIGDLNGDGMIDMAVLAAGDDDGGTDHGAVYILFLDTAATVIGYQKISDTEGGFTGDLTTRNNTLNSTVTEVGDMNGDGIQDIAVGSSGSDDGGSVGSSRGAIWILLMNRDGTVNGFRHYSALTTWPGGNPLTSGSVFGFAVAKLGDLDGDGYNDIAVCARRQGYMSTGLVYILFFNSSGGIKTYRQIGRSGVSTNLGGLKTMVTGNGGQFGWSMDNVGDLNGDGIMDLAIGMTMQNDGFTRAGIVLIAYLNTNGTIQYEEPISQTSSALGLHADALFGYGVGALGDFDGDHVMDLAVTARNYNPGGKPERGRLFILKLNAKPMILKVTSTTDESAGIPGTGKATIEVVGGVRPYEYLWGKDFPDEAAFDLWRDSTEVLPWDTLVFPGGSFDELTYTELLQSATPDLDSLYSGVYYLRVMDQADSSRSTRFTISAPLENAVATGATVSGSGKNYTKTAADGWTNTEVLSTNTLYADDDGWMEFMLPQSGKMLAVGFREFGLAQLNGYEQMAHAFYFDGTHIQLWYAGALHSTGLTYTTGDRFRLERVDQAVIYSKNDAPIDTVIDPVPKDYTLDLTLYTNGAQVRDLITGAQPAGSFVRIIPRVAITQMSCDNSIARVHATYIATAGFTGITYAWTPGPSPLNSPDFTTTVPGQYTLTITGTHGGDTYSSSTSFWLGYKVDWTELASCLPDAPPYTHTLKHIPTPAHQASAVSANETSDWDAHWVMNTLSPLYAGLGTSEHLYFQDLINGTDVAGIYLRRVGGTTYYYVRAYRKTGASTAYFTLPITQQGKRLFMRVSANHLVLKAFPVNGTNATLWSTTWTNALTGTGDPHRIQGRVVFPNSRLVQVLTSMPCGQPQRALLTDDLLDGYHRADRKKLLFAYTEDYGDTGGTLDCIVHAMDGTPIITTSLSVDYGYNELEIPLVSGGDEIDEGFYSLVVTNSKGIKQYLRFHYQPLVP